MNECLNGDVQQRGSDMARVAALRRLDDVDLDGLGFSETALNMPTVVGCMVSGSTHAKNIVDARGVPAQITRNAISNKGKTSRR